MGYYNVPIGTSLSWTIYETGLCKLAVSSGSFQAALQSHSVMPKDWKLCKPPPSQIFSRKLSLVLISSVQKASFKTLGLNAWVTMHTWKGCLWNGRKLEKQEPDLGGWPIAVAQTCRWVCWLWVHDHKAHPWGPLPGHSWEHLLGILVSCSEWSLLLLVPGDTALLRIWRADPSLVGQQPGCGGESWTCGQELRLGPDWLESPEPEN